ncbi:membrane-spanning 4-domains subfamily A member 4A-like isoform X3 [Alosa alosa]|nr:membrane-spanning 4-domains subfamily A member 4A-like isoform X3 [Alosa alosa]
MFKIGMANSASSTNGFVVLTRVFHQRGAQHFTSLQSGVVSTPPSFLGKFLKGEPTAMGTVQIMIGVVVFLFGIVTAFYASTVSSHTGIMFWGAIIYIIAGSLTVRAVKMLNPCLVKASLGMNIFSTITAGLAIILHSFDFLVPMYPYSYDCYGDDYYDNCYMKNAYKTRTLGIAGVTLVLSVLEFIVSICVSAFACKATCTTTGQVMYISNQVPPFVSTSHFSAPPLNTSEMPPFQSSVVPPAYHSSVDGLKVGRSEDLPPEYTPTQE